jgi:hypothetical protein
MFKQRVTRAFHVYYYSTCGSTQKDLVMKVLTAKEVNFVSGGSINGQDDPWNYSSDSGDGSSGSSGSCDVPGSQSTSSCLAPGGFMNTGMPSTSGNSGSGNGESNQNAHNQMCEAIAATQVIGTSVALAGAVAAVAGAGALGGAVAAMGAVTGGVATGASYIAGC